MKKFLAILITLALCTSLFAVAAVADENDGIVKVALNRNFNALDGFTGNVVSMGVAYDLFDTLTIADGENNVQPRLATAWEQIDDYNWRITHREGVKFTNGEDFTPESAVHSIHHAVSLGTTYQNWKQWGEAWPPTAAVESENTIIITTPAPCMNLPVLLTRGAMIPLEASQEESFWSNPIGSGPFKLVSWNVGVQVVVEANEEYWGGAPAVKGVQYDIITDGDAREAIIRTGEYDYVVNVPMDFAVEMKNNNTTPMELVEHPTTSSWYFYFNGTSDNPLVHNPTFREALIYAIDHQPICDFLLAGVVDSGKSISPLYLRGAYDAGGYPERNVEKAQQLLKEAGYNGEPITFIYSGEQFNNDMEILELIMSELQEVGVNVEYMEVDSSTWKSQYKNSGVYDIACNSYGGTYTGDTEMYYTQGVRDIGWTIEAAEELLKKTYTPGITDEERIKCLEEIMKISWEHKPYLWGSESLGTFAKNPKLEGVFILPTAQISFTNAYFEK